MSSSIERKREARTAFMNRLYDVSSGSESFYDNYMVIGDAVGLDDWQDAHDAAQYLVGEGLARWVTTDGGIGISHQGVVEVERSRTSPDQPTEHFAPFNMIVGTFYNSQIQQGTAGSFQLNQPVDGLREIVSQIITAYRENIDELDLAQEQRSEAEAELATLEAQISSPNPKRPILATSLHALRDFATSAGGSVAAQATSCIMEPSRSAVGRLRDCCGGSCW